MKLSWRDLWLWRVGVLIAAFMLGVNVYIVWGTAIALSIGTLCLILIYWIGPREITRASFTRSGTLPIWIIVIATIGPNIVQFSKSHILGLLGTLLMLGLYGLCTMHDLPLVHAKFPPPGNPRVP